MALRVGKSAEADKYRPIFGQQRPQPSMSIPMGGFMGQNQIGGQSTMNIYRSPNSQLALKQQGSGQMGSMPGQLSSFGSSSPDQPSSFDQRAEQYQKSLAEFNLEQQEAELAKRKAEAEEIASGEFMINGEAVSREERDQYQKGIEKQSGIIGSLAAFQKDPSKFFMGGGQDLGELTNYLGQANQLFRATGQEGNLMDFILGSTPSKQDQMRQFNLKTFQRAAPGIDFPSIGQSRTSVMGQSSLPKKNSSPSMYVIPSARTSDYFEKGGLSEPPAFLNL